MDQQWSQIKYSHKINYLAISWFDSKVRTTVFNGMYFQTTMAQILSWDFRRDSMILLNRVIPEAIEKSKGTLWKEYQLLKKMHTYQNLLFSSSSKRIFSIDAC